MTVALAAAGRAFSRVPPSTRVGTHVVRRFAPSMECSSSHFETRAEKAERPAAVPPSPVEPLFAISSRIAASAPFSIRARPA